MNADIGINPMRHMCTHNVDGSCTFFPDISHPCTGLCKTPFVREKISVRLEHEKLLQKYLVYLRKQIGTTFLNNTLNTTCFTFQELSELERLEKEGTHNDP